VRPNTARQVRSNTGRQVRPNAVQRTVPQRRRCVNQGLDAAATPSSRCGRSRPHFSGPRLRQPCLPRGRTTPWLGLPSELVPGNLLLGLELPPNEPVSAVSFLPSSPFGAQARFTGSCFIRLIPLCDTPAATVKGMTRNPYVLHRIFTVIPNCRPVIPSSYPLHPQVVTNV
jgi:hypothetical protein